MFRVTSNTQVPKQFEVKIELLIIQCDIIQSIKNLHIQKYWSVDGSSSLNDFPLYLKVKYKFKKMLLRRIKWKWS